MAHQQDVYLVKFVFSSSSFCTILIKRLLHLLNGNLSIFNQNKKQTQCRPPGMPPGPSVGPAPASLPNAQSRHSITSNSRPESPTDMERSNSAVPPVLAGDDSSSIGSASITQQSTPQQQQSSRDVLGGGNPFLTRRGTEDGTPLTAGSLARSFFTRSSSQQAQEGSVGGGGTDDGEDTMKNLRKTFAGIFGDM